MLPTIQFDDQTNLDACEVRKVHIHRMLSTKLQAQQLAISQLRPQQGFGIGLMTA
jgi:hypothetical protein